MKSLDGISRCHGLSLVELIVSMAVTSLIILAMGSTLLIAGKAMPGNGQPEVALLEATQAAQSLAQDLQYAIDVNRINAHAIGFSVADRDDDEAPEWLLYQWSGTAGDPLVRQYNDGNSVTIMEDVQNFFLNYTWQEQTETTATTVEDGTTLLTGYANANSGSGFQVQDGQWCAQYIKPYLSSSALAWSLGYLNVYCKCGTDTQGEFTVQIQTATAGGYPSGQVLAEQSVEESSLTSSYALKRFTFSGVTDLDPDQGICVVFIWDSGSDEACYLHLDTNAWVDSSYFQFLTSTDDGASWTTPSYTCLRFYLYGTTTYSGSDIQATSRSLQNVGITLSSQNQDRAEFQTRVNLINQPEVMN